MPFPNSLSNSEKFTHQFARHSQSLAWFFLYPIFHLNYKIKIDSREKLKNAPVSALIVANHVRIYDSFFFSIMLGPYAKQLPLRFIGVSKSSMPIVKTLDRLGVISFIYSLFSVLVVVPGAGLEKNTSGAIKALLQNESVVIYPEGRISPDGILKPGTFRQGASLMAISTGKDVLPVSFRITKRPWRRSLVDIHVGDPFTLDSTLSQEQGTEIIYQKVSELFLKN